MLDAEGDIILQQITYNERFHIIVCEMVVVAKFETAGSREIFQFSDAADTRDSLSSLSFAMPPYGANVLLLVSG